MGRGERESRRAAGAGGMRELFPRLWKKTRGPDPVGIRNGSGRHESPKKEGRIAEVLRGWAAREKCKPLNFLHRSFSGTLHKILSSYFEQTKIRTDSKKYPGLTSALSVIYVIGNDI